MTIASKRQKEIAQELQMLLNLIDKQQKDYISKDKIREKIKEYQEKYNNYPNYTPRDFEFRQEYLYKFRALEEILKDE